MEKHFYFFRHGETSWNRELRVQGSVDKELNEEGKSQAEALSNILVSKNIEVIYSSHLRRAKETAEIVAKKCEVDIIERVDLRECHFGDIEGMLYQEVKDKYGEDLWQRFRRSNPMSNETHYPNAESPSRVFKRVSDCLHEILDSKETTIGISTHGAVLRNFIHPLTDESHWPLPIPNCAIFHLKYFDNKWHYIGTIEE